MSAHLPAITEAVECPLAYASRLQARVIAQVDLVVIHCTELPDLTLAREYGERELYPLTGTGNSGHYYIDRDGTLQQWVPLDRVAHHTRGCNSRSVGIELVNTGRYPHWLAANHQSMAEPYPQPQILALVALLQSLHRALPALRWIAGHEDLDTSEVPASDDPQRSVRRKRDPGPLFPWQQVLDAVPLERLRR